jgi:hypothetical protein
LRSQADLAPSRAVTLAAVLVAISELTAKDPPPAGDRGMLRYPIALPCALLVTMKAGDRMTGASGADFMYMWTQILEGPKGLGEDFDFFYFAGPSDFAGYFALTGQADLERLEAWFDTRAAQDPAFKTSVDQGGITKAGFRNYYGLRASVAFSYGSHDEWNIARLINDRRRGATDFGIANQLAVFFDGHPVTPGGYENPTASGDVGRCVK